MAPAKRERSGAPPTRAERRRLAQARRNRLFLILGVIVSAAVVVAWFPASDLLHQRQQLASASSELHQLQGENRSLRRQAKELETPAAVGRIAQEQYDLVSPGEQAYQVLPPSSSDGDGLLATPPAGSTRARSGSAPTSATSSASAASAGTSTSAAGSTGSTGSAGFLGRVLQTLEFWR